ncbi:MAG TPA: OmpA family protein [Steroidobacteraceae bacterium]|nr:OmpA family protein [Steroidobacteraceae bacterium]
MRAPVAVGLMCLLLAGCETGPQSRSGTASPAQPATLHVTEVKPVPNPCDLSRQRLSAVGGGALGAVIGFGACRLASEVLARKSGTADKNRISAGCAVAGSIVGYTWAADTARRRCEVYQIAQRSQLNAQFEEVTVVRPPASSEPAHAKNEEATVSVTTLPGLGHFAPGSAALTPPAQQYFTAIARQYTFEAQKASLARSLSAEQQQRANDPQTLEALRKDWDRIPIVLVGHTDDTGSDATNASLSEQRARAVAEVFRVAGVSPERIYYQGAGSSLPVGDNRTEEGRARNRRVEVIELPPGSDVAQYLALREPNPDLFRPLPQSVPLAAPAQHAAGSDDFEDVPVAKAPPSTPARSRADRPTPTPRASGPAITASPPPLTIDFGGAPAPARMSAIAEALGRPKVDKGSWGFIQSAVAEDEPIYAVACTRDAPDLDRPLPARQLSTGLALPAYQTREYLPGFNDAAWLGSTNGHGIGLNHVAILRDGDTPVSEPDVLVYRDMDRTGNMTANLTAHSRVKVYEGEKALLYRVFVQQPALRCLDIVVPAKGGLDAQLGNLYYERDRKIFTAPYTPKRLQAQ